MGQSLQEGRIFSSLVFVNPFAWNLVYTIFRLHFVNMQASFNETPEHFIYKLGLHLSLKLTSSNQMSKNLHIPPTSWQQSCWAVQSEHRKAMVRAQTDWATYIYFFSSGLTTNRHWLMSSHHCCFRSPSQRKSYNVGKIKSCIFF